MVFSTSSEAHGWIPQTSLSPKTKRTYGVALRTVKWAKKIPVFYVVYPSYRVNNAMLTTKNARKRALKLITFKSVYGAIIAIDRKTKYILNST